MKRNLKGLIALSFSAFMAVGILTGTIILVTGDTAAPEKVASITVSTTIRADESSTKNDVLTDMIVDNNIVKTNSANTLAEQEADTILPEKQVIVDSGSSSNTNKYLYGKYLRAIEAFIGDYYNYYNPSGVANKQITTLYAANSNDSQLNLFLNSAKNSVANSVDQAPLLTAAAPKVYANVASVKQDNSQLKISSEDLEAFVLWHLAENYDNNIQAAYKELSKINTSSSIDAWNKFCLEYTNFKYSDAYDEEVNEFMGYYFDNMPNGPFMTNCCYTNIVEGDKVDDGKDEVYNLKKEEVLKDTVNLGFIPSDFTTVSLEKKANAIIDLSSMSEAEFDKYAKEIIKGIIGVEEKEVCCDDVLVLTTGFKKAYSPFDELKEKFSEWHLDLNDDNVYRAWVDLNNANNNDYAYDNLADRFEDYTLRLDYEDHIDTFLAAFASEYGIADMDDVDDVIDTHLANLDIEMDRVDKVDCVGMVKNEEAAESKPANPFDDMANTLKGRFMYWHLNNNDNYIEDALEDIAIINAFYSVDDVTDMGEWYDFADEFYYELTGFYPVNELADSMEEVDIAAEDCNDDIDEALDQNTINMLHASATACVKELGFADDGEEIANFVTNLVANIGNNNAITLVANLNSGDSDTAEKAHNEMMGYVSKYFSKAEDKLADINDEEIKKEKLTDEEIEKIKAEEEAKAKAAEASAGAAAGAAEGAGASAGAADGDGGSNVEVPPEVDEAVDE